MEEKISSSIISDMYMELPIAVVLYDNNGCIVDCNDAACSLFGYAQAEMQTLAYVDLLPEKFSKIITDKFQHEKLTNNEFLWVIRRHKNGELFECEEQSKNLIIEGRNYCLSLYRRTEFVGKGHSSPADNVIKDSPKMTTATFVIFTWQEIEGELRLIGYNPAMDESTQGNIRSYIGCTAHELYEHRGRIDHINIMYDVYRKKGIFREETFCDFLINDNFRFVDCVSLYVPPDLLIQFGEDVTERRQTLSALKQSEKRFKSLYIGSPIPVITWRHIKDTFVLIDYNDAMYSFTKGSIAGLMGSSATIIFSQYPELVKDIILCYEKQTTLYSEQAIKLITNGDKRYLTFICTYIPDDIVLTYINDITEKKRAEIDLLRSQQELSNLYEKNINILERERQRISQELHDGIGQYLSSIKFSIENMLLGLEKGNAAEDLNDQLRSSIDLLKEAIMDVARISMDLRPSILDDLGLIATINWFLREFCKTYKNIDVIKQITIDEREVPRPIKTVMYRILQESMNNIARHSNATNAKIRLHKTDKFIELIIEDNGKGFHLDELYRSKAGLGIAGMRERVTLSKGSFSIKSAVGNGTCIKIAWPLADQAMLNSVRNHRRSAG